MIDKSSPQFRTFYGWAELHPRHLVPAGSLGTWRVTYRVGRYGIDDSGMIRVARRFVSDWGVPQTSDSRAPNYMSISTTGKARVRARYDPKAHVRPWQKAITIYVDDGFLTEGDTVTLTLGDTSDGSPGTTAQTFCEPRFELKVLVDCFGTGVFVELESAGTFEIVSGPASTLKFILPTDTTIGEPFRVSLKVEDQWGNPATTYEGRVQITGADYFEAVPETVAFNRTNEGVCHLEGVYARKEGVHWLEAEAPEGGPDGKAIEDSRSRIDQNLRTTSNAIAVHRDAPPLRRFWGDLHGQSEETVGSKNVDEYFAFARDKALVDFAGHQGNCFQITRGIWRRIRETVKRHHQPGQFVTFLGYEWSGLTAGGGDRNVYFLGDDGPLHRCSHWLVEDRSDADTDCYPVTELYERLRGRDDVLIIPHVGGRYANLQYHDPVLEPLIEICSSWGEFEWLFADALQHGCRVGITCGSDDHKGRPGASYPGSGTFGVRGGLLCIFATELTRAALWDALWKRHCYGTTGERIALEFEADDAMMGDELETSHPPTFRVKVGGTGEIERIELRCGVKCVAVYPNAAQVIRSERDVRIQWSGVRNKGRERAARWDGFIECDGTTIIGAKGYAFDSPAEGLAEINERRLAWKSVTTGDSDGVILTLHPPDHGTLRLVSEFISFELPLEELKGEPIVYDAGGLGLRVTVERQPQGIGRHVRAELSDSVLPEIVTPYHVMVLQCDGAKAWSSPIWVQPNL